MAAKSKSPRVSPTSIDSETAFIGALLEHPAIIQEDLGVTVPMFSDSTCATILSAALDAFLTISPDRAQSFSKEEIFAKAEAHGLTLNDATAMPYLNACSNWRSWKAYAARIKAVYRRRLIFEAGGQLQDLANEDPKTPIIEVINDAETIMYTALDPSDANDEPQQTTDELIDGWFNDPRPTRGYLTGIPALDKATGGLGVEGFGVWIAPPGSGKTTLIAQMAIAQAAQCRDDRTGTIRPVLVVPTEMSRQIWEARLTANLCGADMYSFASGSWTNPNLAKNGTPIYRERMNRKNQVRQELNDLQSGGYLLFSKGNSPTAKQIAMDVKRHRPGMVIIDTINNVGMVQSKLKEIERLQDSANQFQDLFTSQHIYVTVVSQMNKESLMRGGTPNPTDARGIGPTIYAHATHYFSLLRWQALINSGIIDEDDKRLEGVDPNETNVYFQKDRMYGREGQKIVLSYDLNRGGYYCKDDVVHSMTAEQMMADLHYIDSFEGEDG